MVEPGDIEDLENEFEELLSLLEDEERLPTEEEEERIEEIQRLIDVASELEIQEFDIEERRERLLDNDPVILPDGEIDTWERWREESGSP
mgnify:CR=1 FL=1|tara:strand:- start:1782 stop:2051 length:270 start_codon:yes stop_codon:yes gene_type:complete